MILIIEDFMFIYDCFHFHLSLSKFQQTIGINKKKRTSWWSNLDWNLIKTTTFFWFAFQVFPHFFSSFAPPSVIKSSFLSWLWSVTQIFCAFFAESQWWQISSAHVYLGEFFSFGSTYTNTHTATHSVPLEVVHF